MRRNKPANQTSPGTSAPHVSKPRRATSHVMKLALVGGLASLSAGYILLDFNKEETVPPAEIDLRPPSELREQLAKGNEAGNSASLLNHPEALRIQEALSKLNQQSVQSPSETQPSGEDLADDIDTDHIDIGRNDDVDVIEDPEANKHEDTDYLDTGPALSVEQAPADQAESDKAINQEPQYRIIRDPVTGNVIEQHLINGPSGLLNAAAAYKETRLDKQATLSSVLSSSEAHRRHVLAIANELYQETRAELLAREDIQGLIIETGQRVSAQWAPPPEEDLGKVGAVVGIEVDASGNIVSAEIERSSGSSALNASVLQATKDAAPLKPLAQISEADRRVIGALRLTFGAAPSEEQFASAPSQESATRAVSSNAYERSNTLYPLVTVEDFDYFDAAAFMQTVKGKIQSNYRPLEDAGDLAGDATLKVSLQLPYGFIDKIEVVHSSGSGRFDKAVAQAIDKSEPFEEARMLPDEIQPHIEHFNLHFWEGGLR